jgi:hypothetical protein
VSCDNRQTPAQQQEGYQSAKHRQHGSNDGHAAPVVAMKRSDQYRATMMMAATMNAAISERARSKFFDLGCTSRGGMTLRLLCHGHVPGGDGAVSHAGFPAW